MRFCLAVTIVLAGVGSAFAYPTLTIGPDPTNQGPGFSNPVPTQSDSTAVSNAGPDSGGNFNYTIYRTCSLATGPRVVGHAVDHFRLLQHAHQRGKLHALIVVRR